MLFAFIGCVLVVLLAHVFSPSSCCVSGVYDVRVCSAASSTGRLFRFVGARLTTMQQPHVRSVMCILLLFRFTLTPSVKRKGKVTKVLVGGGLRCLYLHAMSCSNEGSPWSPSVHEAMELQTQSETLTKYHMHLTVWQKGSSQTSVPPLE